MLNIKRTPKNTKIVYASYKKDSNYLVEENAYSGIQLATNAVKCKLKFYKQYYSNIEFVFYVTKHKCKVTNADVYYVCVVSLIPIAIWKE